jgi:hypothetical protein
VRVLVFGSRDWTDETAIHLVLDGYRAQHPDEELTVLHGGAPGADRIAGRWAMHRRITGATYPADWDQHGKGAGPIRNQRMLDEGLPDTAWGFVNKPLEESRGSADMARRARKAGIPTYVVNAT